MRFLTLALATAIVASLVLSTTTMAGGALDIRKTSAGGVVEPIDSNTGPVNDPDAIHGQWFTGGARTHEFYDNRVGYGGSSEWSTDSILGRAKNLVWDQGNIVAFDIEATITNDTAWRNGVWSWGNNSLNEYHEGGTPPPDSGFCYHDSYVGGLVDAVLTGDFAISDLQNVPGAWAAPYADNQPYVVAANEDRLAWYGGTDTGAYYVPTWDFGDIAIGESVTRLLSFTVSGGGFAIGDARYTAIVDSNDNGSDLFANRSTSLKISNWLDNLALDDGSAYPTTSGISSNVGVFFVTPEPGSLLALGTGLVGIVGIGRRRRS